MDGVEILNQTNIYQTEYSDWVFWLILAICFAIGLVVAIIEWVDFGFNMDGVIALVVCTVIGFFLGIAGGVMTEHETDKLDYIEYQVTVSNEVNFNEFLEKYEILGQEGKIYTVKERK